MALNGAAISSAISALDIDGVTIKDVSGIPQSVQTRDCPILFPMPGNWYGGGNAVNEDKSTFGTAGSRYWTTSHAMNYVYLHSEVGTGRGNADNYASAVEDIEDIVEAVTALDVSGVDVAEISHNPIGILTDPSGRRFTGCEVTITLRQRINA